MNPLKHLGIFSNSRPSLQALYGGASGVFEVQEMSAFDKFLKDNKGRLVVVDFFATWCMPCRRISPVFEELSTISEYTDVSFAKIDVDQFPDIAQKFNVVCMPTFVFLRNGEIIDTVSGADVNLLKQTIHRHMQ